MLFFRKPPQKPERKVADWIGAILGMVTLAMALVGGVLHLDGRILRLEGQNNQIQEDLSELSRTIDEKVYSRREAELEGNALDARIEGVSDRVSRLEGSNKGRE